MKKTDPADPDYNDLTVALSKVSEVADHINNSIRERENLEKLSAIQKKLSGTVPVCTFMFVEVIFQPNCMAYSPSLYPEEYSFEKAH